MRGRVVAIVQARTESSRLPGKVLADIAGAPMVLRVLSRAAAASLVHKVVLATTEDPSDDVLDETARAAGYSVFRGSVDDVLDRYWGAATAAGADVVVRITADCPLLDQAVVDRTVEAFLDGGCDYASTAYPTTSFPDGLDVEVMSLETLGQAWREARWRSEREHVTPYIWKNPERFCLRSVSSGRDLSGMRWTVDEEPDLVFVREIYRHLGEQPFGMEEVLALLEKRPELARINGGIRRNEGYETSVSGDVEVRGGRTE